ncbi:MAG: aegerolysin family protein [Hyphomicrobiales bacterium]
MAYAQWVEINISPLNFEMTVKNVKLDWGKFYEKGNKDKEINKSEIEGMTVDKGQKKVICACGRSDSPSGTEGSFELYNGDELIGKYYWDCPWGSKTNTSTWTAKNDKYLTQAELGNLDSGAIGQVTIVSASINAAKAEGEDVKMLFENAVI